MPAPLMSRQEVVNRLFEAFRTYGYEGATLARLSNATGLGRASLYHYFPDGKEGMVREVLDTARTWISENIKMPLERTDTSAATRVRTTMKNLAAGYDNGLASCIVNLLGVGDAKDVARAELRLATEVYLSGFESFLRAVGVTPAKAREQALQTVTEIEGALVMARALDDRTVFTKCIERLEKQYLKLARGA